MRVAGSGYRLQATGFRLRALGSGLSAAGLGPAGVDSSPVSLLGGRRRPAPAGHAIADGDVTAWVDLVRRIEQGDRDAEAELARQFYVRVRPLASAHLRKTDVAVDIAQETILAALEALRAGKLREPEKLPAFVLGIARNLINNYRRKQAASPEVHENPPDRPVEPGPDLTRLESERRALVRACIEQLSPLDRRILLLTLREGLSPREIAPILGLPAEVVRTRKSRAVKVLADEIDAVTRTPRRGHVPTEGSE